MLHNQAARVLRSVLRNKPGIVNSDVPYQMEEFT
jgi:hypothetical protein